MRATRLGPRRPAPAADATLLAPPAPPRRLRALAAPARIAEVTRPTKRPERVGAPPRPGRLVVPVTRQEAAATSPARVGDVVGPGPVVIPSLLRPRKAKATLIPPTPRARHASGVVAEDRAVLISLRGPTVARGPASPAARRVRLPGHGARNPLLDSQNGPRARVAHAGAPTHAITLAAAAMRPSRRVATPPAAPLAPKPTPRPQRALASRPAPPQARPTPIGRSRGPRTIMGPGAPISDGTPATETKGPIDTPPPLALPLGVGGRAPLVPLQAKEPQRPPRRGRLAPRPRQDARAPRPAIGGPPGHIKRPLHAPRLGAPLSAPPAPARRKDRPPARADLILLLPPGPSPPAGRPAARRRTYTAVRQDPRKGAPTAPVSPALTRVGPSPRGRAHVRRPPRTATVAIAAARPSACLAVRREVALLAKMRGPRAGLGAHVSPPRGSQVVAPSLTAADGARRAGAASTPPNGTTRPRAPTQACTCATAFVWPAAPTAAPEPGRPIRAPKEAVPKRPAPAIRRALHVGPARAPPSRAAADDGPSMAMKPAPTKPRPASPPREAARALRLRGRRPRPVPPARTDASTTDPTRPTVPPEVGPVRPVRPADLTPLLGRPPTGAPSPLEGEDRRPKRPLGSAHAVVVFGPSQVTEGARPSPHS